MERQELEGILLYITKLLILFGLVVILIGLTMAIYYAITKRRDNKWKESFWTVIFGLSIIIAGMLLSYMIGYEPDYTSYGRSIPKWYIPFLMGYILCQLFLSKKEDH